MVAPFRLLRWRWREIDAGFGRQDLPHNPSDEVLDLDGIDVPSQQVDGVGPLPFSALIGALTAGRTAIDGWATTARAQLELFLAEPAACASTTACSGGG